MTGWFNKNNYLKKEISVDNYNYEIYLKEKITAPASVPRLVIVSYQPNKDTSELLELCIKSIKKFTDTGYELWIIDNNSPQENIKWLDPVENINIAYVRTDPKEGGGSYANAFALEAAAKLIDPGTKYFMSLHEDTVVCRYGWLKYVLSKFDRKIKAAGFRLTRARIPDGVLHVCGYMVDFQFLKKNNLSFLPQLPDLDVGDKVICEIKKSGFKIFSTPNTFDDAGLVELIPETLAARDLNVTRSFNDKNEIIYMHLGRGVPKAKGTYRDQKKCSLKEWSEYIRGKLFSEPVLQKIKEEKLKAADFSKTSIIEFYTSSFFEENLDLLPDKSKILYFGKKEKILDKYDFNSGEYSETKTYNDYSFDSVLFSEASDTLNGAEDLLKKFYKSLNIGGILLITIPLVIGDDIRCFKKAGHPYQRISDKLWEMGFREVSVKEIGSYHSISLYLEYKKFVLKLKGMNNRAASVKKNKFIKKRFKNILALENKSGPDRKLEPDIITAGYGITAVK